MSDIDAAMASLPLVEYPAGHTLLHQDEKVASIYILKSGKVRVEKDGTEVAISSDPGAVFGEMSTILEMDHSASVHCLTDAVFYHIEDPQVTLKKYPELLWHIARILCLRLFNLNQYLVDLKSQFEGHDHLGMVDEVLETLMNQQRTNVLKRAVSKRDTGGY